MHSTQPKLSRSYRAEDRSGIFTSSVSVININNCLTDLIAMSRLDNALVTRAVTALLKFDEKRSSSSGGSKLIDDYARPLNAQIQLLSDISTPVLKPVRVKLPNTIFHPSGSDEHTVCLFCRSEDKEAVVDFLTKNTSVIPGLDANTDGSVLSINDVKKYYKEFKDLKALAHKFTHFLCDGRVMSHLYNLLGKSFGARNNYPTPIDFQHVERLPAAANKALNCSTYIHLRGKCINVRLGNTSMTKENLVQNAMQGLDFAIAEKLPKGWPGVHSVSLKLADSAALPVYARDNSDAGVAYMKSAVAPEAAASNDGASSSKNKSTKTPTKTPSKGEDKAKASGVKRARDSDDLLSVEKASKPKGVLLKQKEVKMVTPKGTPSAKKSKAGDDVPPPPKSAKKKHEFTPEGAVVRKSMRTRK